MNLTDRVARRGDSSEPVSPENGEAERLLKDYLAEVNALAARLRHEPWDQRAKDYTAGQVILSAAPSIQAEIARLLVAWLERRQWHWSNDSSRRTTLLEDLTRRRLPFSAEDLHHFLKTELPERYPGTVIRMVEQYAAEHGLPEAIRPLLARLQFQSDSEGRRHRARIDTLLGKAAPLPLKSGEPWSDAVLTHLRAEASTRGDWEALIVHAHTATAAKPSGKWLKQAEACLHRVGQDSFEDHVIQWLDQSGQMPEQTLDEANSEVLKGLVWCCALSSRPDVIRALGTAAESSYRKVPGWGPRSEKVGNACVTILAAMPGTEPAAQLNRLQLRVKHRPALRLIEKALATAAERAGMTPDDLTELSVPSFGMQSPGLLEQALGGFTAVVEVTGAHNLDWRWRGPDGRLQKAVPAAVKAHHPEELKALKQRVSELQKQLPTQRDRLERILLSERSWSLDDWRQRYLEHPLLAPLARRLIWQFQDGQRALLALPLEGRLTDAVNQPVEGLSETTRVRLWHPIGFAPAEVLRWRVWLEEHGVTQPFKQAHREVYLLTEAEVRTRTYSNRFAAHLLKQHQLKALCEARGWVYHLQGTWDSGHPPMAQLQLPGWEMRAEYWVEAVAYDYRLDHAGAPYVSTDQVRFFRDGHQAPLPLTEVPALVFTEVMRDVDLFVGVASVGNDPAWADTGARPGQRDYWSQYSFGDLSASAITRQGVLERLLPRLKIRERCRLDGKFLHVRGDLRGYKIQDPTITRQIMAVR